MKFDFDCSDIRCVVQSPEDKINRQNLRIMSTLHRYINLKTFDDIKLIFENNECITASSLVLAARCEYFRSMFRRQAVWKERSFQISIQGIQKPYFEALIQYFYTDTFRFEQPHSLCTWVNFLIYADYFLLTRVMELCAEKLTQCIRTKNVVPLLLIA